MKSRVSLQKSNNYLFSHFLKQYKAVLSQLSIGECLGAEQIKQVLIQMGYIDDQPNDNEYQLVKTIAWLLTQGQQTHVSRENLFRFFMVASDIKGDSKDHFDSFQGVPNDEYILIQPTVPVNIGSFDTSFRWKYTQEQAKTVKGIFSSMNAKRLSRNTLPTRKKLSIDPLNQSFRPNILPRSAKMAQSHLKKLYIDISSKVEDRLLLSRSRHKEKRQRQMAKSLQKQMVECTFKPYIIPNKQNSRFINDSSCFNHPDKLINKGQEYLKKRVKLQQNYKKVNQKSELQQCTFKPITCQRRNSVKYVCVKNKDKVVQRLKKGRKQREFVNQVKERGYPEGVSWSQYMNSRQGGIVEQSQPILCIDLRLLNEQHNIDVYEGQNLVTLSEHISKENNIPKSSWWKVEDLIRKALQSCPDVEISDQRIRRK